MQHDLGMPSHVRGGDQVRAWHGGPGASEVLKKHRFCLWALEGEVDNVDHIESCTTRIKAALMNNQVAKIAFFEPQGLKDELAQGLGGLSVQVLMGIGGLGCNGFEPNLGANLLRVTAEHTRHLMGCPNAVELDFEFAKPEHAVS